MYVLHSVHIQQQFIRGIGIQKLRCVEVNLKICGGQMSIVEVKANKAEGQGEHLCTEEDPMILPLAQM